MEKSALIVFGNLSNTAYVSSSISSADVSAGALGYSLVAKTDSMLSGYNGLSAYNPATNTLVIASGGTYGVLDWINDGVLAPEVLVEEIIDAFAARYAVSVSIASTADENVFFPLPRPLREAAE